MKDYTSLKDRDHNSHQKHQHSSNYKEERSGKKHSSSNNVTEKDRERSSSKDKSRRDDHSSSGKSGDISDRKDRNHHNSSDKHVSSRSKTDSSSHSSHKTDRNVNSESTDTNHKRDKSVNLDKSKSEKSKHEHKHSSSSKHSSGKSSESSSKHKSSSSKGESSKSSHSSSDFSKLSDKSSKPSKTSAKDLSLEELRAQVKQMKQDLEPLEKPSTTVPNTPTGSNVNPNMFQPYKNRQGVDVDEAEKRKAQILTKTQLILQRTKEKLAREQEEAKQPKKRLGKTATGARKEKDASGQIKSKSLCKDDSDFEDDQDEPLRFETSFNEEYLTQGPGSILKTIKNKIDEKLSNYNFPDKPEKEKSERKKKEKILKETKEKTVKEKIKKDKYRVRGESEEKPFKHDKSKISSFSSNNDLKQNKSNKPKIIKRHQVQPPPMNFQDLLKLAEVKSKEKVVEPEPIFKPPKKEERPMTQEERERHERQKESRKRVKEEVMEFRKKNLNSDNSKSDSPNISRAANEDKLNSKLSDSKRTNQHIPEKDGSKLKAALTGNHTVPVLEKFAKPGMISSKPSAFSKQNSEKDKPKSSKYDSENESVISCGPSSSKPSSKPVNPYQGESSNPWDRIYGQIQKKNPKAGNLHFHSLDMSVSNIYKKDH